MADLHEDFTAKTACTKGCSLTNIKLREGRRILLTHGKIDFPADVKLKVKLSLCLTKHHAVKACLGSGGIAPRIL